MKGHLRLLNKLDKNILNRQSQHWEINFSNKPEMFGLEPSYPAKKTLEILQENNISKIVELGSGLGRDTLFFGQNLIEFPKFYHLSTILRHRNILPQ